MKVFVYINNHKKLFSIKALEGENKNKVIDWKQSLKLENVECYVSQNGKEKVREKGKKFVHAGLIGELVEDFSGNYTPDEQIKYNPYRDDHFKNTDDEFIYNANAAFLDMSTGVFVDR